MCIRSKGLNKSILDLFRRTESGACPDSALADQRPASLSAAVRPCTAGISGLVQRFRALFALAACALPLAGAWACGPDFPQRLLDDRKATLLGLPEGTFYFEASRLLPKPGDALRPVEGSPWDDADQARDKADAAGLSAEEIAKVKAMRSAADAGAAATAGAGLAPELFEYTLGAIAFRHHDHAGAIAHFQSVLAIAPPQRSRRGLWALYMLGRAKAAGGDTVGAAAAFETVRERERAASGAGDPLGLAIASFGEQARIEWRAGAVATAVKLYSQQAAYGSQGGAASLLFVSRSVLAHRDLLDKALDDPLSQRMLAAYLFTRSGEFAQDWPLAGTSSDDSRSSDASKEAGARKSPTSMDVEGFLAAVERHGLDRFEGADRLAAGAYNAGHYPLAARLAAKSDSALAAWVRAKLALRAGDATGAQREYAKAAKDFPVDEAWGGDPVFETVGSPRCRVESERGLLALARNDYVEAMARLYAGSSEYWPDAAYVAERVLTMDELKDFVDSNVPAPKSAAPKKDEEARASPAAQIRGLLARRLMRAGRDSQALAYFDDTAVRTRAQALIDARKDDHAWTSVARAAALFQQAQIVREDGMELFGTELAPDNAEWGGGYPAMDLPSTNGKDFVGGGEAARVAASAAQPDARFHYRYVAANMAERAAGLVPARSQAYAAMMCQSTHWMLDTDAASATRIYRRYLHNGAYVKWGKDFGGTCPKPDFATAKWLPWKQCWWNLRHWTRREWPFLLVGLGVLIGLVAWRRRRVKA
jgi:hypothetical protein